MGQIDNMTKKERFSRIAELGCIVCKQFYFVFSQCTVHHLVGLTFRCLGKKAKWEYTIGLCPGHHQYGTKVHPAIHTHPEEFERRFGTQGYLLKLTNELL